MSMNSKRRGTGCAPSHGAVARSSANDSRVGASTYSPSALPLYHLPSSIVQRDVRSICDASGVRQPRRLSGEIGVQTHGSCGRSALGW
eukprot:scaffold329923_cov63-Tisochrysis_lutea.AAC.3